MLLQLRPCCIKGQHVLMRQACLCGTPSLRRLVHCFTTHPTAGMVVSNPSYAGIEPGLEAGLYRNFTNGFYHGSVIWGFVEAMMVEGGWQAPA